jgi:hypothetical protein
VVRLVIFLVIVAHFYLTANKREWTRINADLPC